MNMHTTAINSEDRLWHDRAIYPRIKSTLFHDQPVGHHVIGHCQGVSIPHIDFMLTRSYFMVRIFHAYTKLFKSKNAVPPEISGRIQGGHIEISTLIETFRTFGILEIEVFQFRPDVVCIAHISGYLQVPLEDISRVTFERFAAGFKDVAEHSAYRAVFARSPRQ